MNRNDDPPGRVGVAVFVKFPEPGEVKTRLAAVIGDEAAARAYRAMAEHVVASLAELDSVFIFASPAGRTGDVADWLNVSAGVPRECIAQCEGSLGARILAAVADIRRRGFEKVLVVGTDCIDVSRSILAKAAQELDRADVVLGPARDGGYYLIGIRALMPGMLDGVEWSSGETLRQTVRAAGQAGLRVHVLEDVLEDVDTVVEWERIRGRVGHGLR